MNKSKKFKSFWNSLNPNIKGFLFILLASATFPIMGTIVKYLTAELHPFQIAFFRCFFGLIILLPIIIKNNPYKILNTNRLHLHIYRGLLGIGAIMAGFTALSMMPLATAVTLGYTRILFLVPLAMIFLGEKPGEKSTTIFNSAQKLISDAIDLSPKGPEQPPNKSSNFKLIRGAYGTPVEEFLQTYLENLPNSSETRANLRGLLTEWDLRKNLDSWNIAIHTPATDIKPVEISGLKIGLVNRSSTPAGKIGYIQSGGEDTQLDVHEDEHVRETPLLLLYFVKPSSTIRDEGQERVFHPDVKQPIPIFGVCLPTNLTEEGGTAWTADKSDL